MIWEVTASRAVLLDSEGTTLITLNPVGTLVWDVIDGQPLEELTDLLHPRLEGVTREQLEADVRVFLVELEALGVIVPTEA